MKQLSGPIATIWDNFVNDPEAIVPKGYDPLSNQEESYGD